MDVGQVDLNDPGSTSGGFGTELGKPTVVCLNAGPSSIEVTADLRLAKFGEQTRGKRRRGVGENHFGDDAIGFGLRESTRAVPVASAVDFWVAVDCDASRTHHGSHLHDPFVDFLSPIVKVALPLLLEVVAVRAMLRSRVGVRGDEQVAVHLCQYIRHAGWVLAGKMWRRGRNYTQGRRAGGCRPGLSLHRGCNFDVGRGLQLLAVGLEHLRVEAQVGVELPVKTT